MHVAAGSTKVTKKTTKPTKSNNTKSIDNSDGKLGLAFMSYTSTTTTTKKKKSNDDGVVDIHAVKKPSTKVPQPQQQQQVESSSKESVIERISTKPTFTRMSAAASAPVVQQQAPTSFKRSIPQQYAQMPEYPINDAQPQMMDSDNYNNSYSNNSNNNNINVPKSRKQKREEERALRSGQAFTSTDAIEMHQPSPSEHAPSAEAAVIAAKAARYRGAAQGGGGGGSISNIAMYDPSEGADVKGLGVTGKHRSKHQINQLMASAISLEAHRASEAELARFGAGTGGGNASRADAKKKYGW